MENRKRNEAIRQIYVSTKTILHIFSSISFYPVNQGFRLNNLGKISEMIIFESILNTFEVSTIFRGSWGCCNNWLGPEIKLSKQVKFV